MCVADVIITKVTLKGECYMNNARYLWWHFSIDIDIESEDSYKVKLSLPSSDRGAVPTEQLKLSSIINHNDSTPPSSHSNSHHENNDIDNNLYTTSV